MELFKKILDLIISFLQGYSQKTKKETTLATETEIATVETIRAETNEAEIGQIQKTQYALKDLEKKHQTERKNAKKNKNRDDDQFGSNW